MAPSGCAPAPITSLSVRNRAAVRAFLIATSMALGTASSILRNPAKSPDASTTLMQTEKP